jgi:LPXTG-motif cell wall-anchored protein
MPLTGEQAAIPLTAAAGIIVVVLAARGLRRRSNN